MGYCQCLDVPDDLLVLDITVMVTNVEAANRVTTVNELPSPTEVYTMHTSSARTSIFWVSWQFYHMGATFTQILIR